MPNRPPLPPSAILPARGASLVVYDVETARPVGDPKRRGEDGIEYARDWNDFAGMGLAVLCAYDYAEGRYRVFQDADRALELLLARDVVVGYNSYEFDNAVLAHAVGSIALERRARTEAVLAALDARTYDLLGEIRCAIARRADAGLCSPTRRGTGLERVAAANGIPAHYAEKLGGAAPVLWQRGRKIDVVDYCLEDVRVTRRILEWAFYGASATGAPTIVDPRDPADARALEHLRLELRPLRPQAYTTDRVRL